MCARGLDASPLEQTDIEHSSEYLLEPASTFHVCSVTVEHVQVNYHLCFTCVIPYNTR